MAQTRTASPNLLSSARGAQPRHRPARGHPKRRSIAREARPIARWRFPDDHPKRAAERAQAAEADVETDLRHRLVGLAQQLHRSLYAPALKVPVGGLAERGPELAAEVRRGDVGHSRQ